MIKCGKGFLPECEYYMSAGCVSPFNCPYKVEEVSINSATITPDTGIQKYFQGLVRGGVISQEPMNYDAATLKIYIAHLEAENTELRARLEKAIEVPFVVLDKTTGKEADLGEIALHEEWAKSLAYCDMDGFAITQDGALLLLDECGKFEYCPSDRFEIVAEAILKELKENNNDRPRKN